MVTARLTRKVAVGFCLLLVSACAPGGDGSQPDSGGSFVEPMKLETRDLQFASHIVLQLADLRRAMDDAQNLFPNTRQQSRPGDLYEFGCRTMKKISPDPESDKPGTRERFAILYNCIDSGETFARVDLDGADTYSVGYSSPLPQVGEPKERPIASSISVSGETVYTSHFRQGLYSDRDQVTVLRKTTFNAQVAQMNEKEWIFDVDQQIDDDYDYDVSRTYREGVFTTKIQASVVVDKSSRKVTSITPYSMSVRASGTQWDKSAIDRGASRSNPVAFRLKDYEFEANGSIRLNADTCELPDVNLVIKKAETEIEASSQGGTIAVSDAKSTLMACDLGRAADPLFARVHEGVFY